MTKVSPASPVPINPTWLGVSRLVWILFVILYFGMFLLGIHPFFQQVSTLSGSALEMGHIDLWPGDQFRLAFQDIGLSIPEFTLYAILTNLVPLLVYTVLGILIFLRGSRLLIGWYTSLLLILFGFINGDVFLGLGFRYPEAKSMIDLLIAIPWAMFYGFFLIFPDGRVVPHGALFAGLFILVFVTLSAFLPGINQFLLPFILIAFSVAIFSQLYRYRKVSGPIERQQTNWMVFSVILIFGTVLGAYGFLPAVVQPLSIFGPSLLVYNLVSQVLVIAAYLVLAFSLAIAIFRYRLWNIDIIIRRTLIYGGLSLTLGAVYFGAVLLLQSLFQAISGQKSTAAIVLSTLAIAVLFNPLRHRIQNDIDRLFYRRKYDAQMALESFAASVRNEVELEKLTSQLLTVVNESVQPQQASLWMLKPKK